jgi:histidinol-phosphate/aromatic aminotransferase/cobyric acid decarboxylase-like protein
MYIPRKVHVRPELDRMTEYIPGDFLRVTVGLPEQTDKLACALAKVIA